MKKKNKILDFSRSSTIVPIVKDILKYKKSGMVLDLGTGYGRHAIFLAKKGFHVTAVDKDQERLRELKRRATKMGINMQVRQMDVANLKARRQYDVILAIAMLHFLQKNQVRRVITMMKACTAPHGINVISVHTNKNPRQSRPYLFGAGELKKYYRDWKILQYKEGLGTLFRTKSDGPVVRKYFAAIIAQKI